MRFVPFITIERSTEKWCATRSFNALIRLDSYLTHWDKSLLKREKSFPSSIHIEQQSSDGNKDVRFFTHIHLLAHDLRNNSRNARALYAILFSIGQDAVFVSERMSRVPILDERILRSRARRNVRAEQNGEFEFARLEFLIARLWS